MAAQPAATQEERTEAARRALITAAIDILAEEGYRRLTFTRIQEVAGLSRGLVAYHFGSKVALVENVILTIREEFHDQAQHDPSRTGYDELRGMVQTYLDRFRADPRHAKVMLVLGTDSIGEQGPVTAAVRDTYQTYRDDLANFINRGMADGSIRADIDASAHAIVIEGFLRGIVLQYLVDPTHVDLDAVAAAAFETVDALAA